VSLLLLAAVSVLAAAFLFWNIEKRAHAVVADARSLETRLATAIRQTFDLRSAQQGYVSQGQSEKFWFPKVDAATHALRESLTTVQGASTAPSSRVAMEGAAQALQEFERMDRRAREYAAGNQKILASDLIFSDGLETTEEILAALEQARYVEATDAATARAGARGEQVSFVTAAAGLVLLVLVLLTPAPPDRHAGGAAPAELIGRLSADAERPPDEIGGMAVEPDPAEEFQFRPLARTAAVPLPSPAAPPAEQKPEPETQRVDFAPDIQTVAEVCRELARLADTTALPGVLARAATALDASGVMLWVADPDAVELTAIAAHGYAPHVVSRVGTIRKDGENVIAAAFRTGLLQTLKGNQTAPGAIAAPLVNPSGCIGVMSAEVGHGGERQPARLALATIVAAQLATLVAPATRAHSRSEAV